MSQHFGLLTVCGMCTTEVMLAHPVHLEYKQFADLVCAEQKCPICHKEVAAAQDGSKASAESLKQSAQPLMSKKSSMNA